MDPAIFVRMNEKQGGLLFDISEGGLALDGLTPKSRTAPINLNFHLPSTSATIEARARMVWVDRWNHRIGVRFIDLPETSRLQLREWLSASAISHTGHWQKETPAPVSEPRLRVVPSVLTDVAPNSTFQNSVADAAAKPRRLDGLFWGLVFLSSTLFLFAFLMSRTQQPSQAQQFAPVAAPSAAASGAAPAASSPALVPSQQSSPQSTPQSAAVSTPPASASSDPSSILQFPRTGSCLTSLQTQAISCSRLGQ